MRYRKKFLLVSVFTTFLVGGLGVGKLASFEKETLSGYQDSFRCPNDQFVEPSTVEELINIVSEAIKSGKSIMAGTRKFKSQIDAACADAGGLQIVTNKLDKLVAVDVDQKRMTVQSGMKFYKFNRIAAKYGLAVNMVTELETFTIGGMLGSGTHGSTLWKPSALIADYVTEMKILSSQLDENGQAKIITLTGDELDAARVNLGVLGIVVEVTFQMEDLFKVSASAVKVKSDENIENEVLNYPVENYSVSIGWFPGLNKYTVTTYTPVGVETPGTSRNSQADSNRIEQSIAKSIFDGIHERRSRLFDWIGEATQKFAAKQRAKQRESSYWTENGKVVDKPIGYSYDMQYFGCKGEPYLDENGVEQLNPEKNCVWDSLRIQLQETAIPFRDLPAWIADVKSILKKSPKTYFPLNGIYFRFGRQSRSHLAMAAARDGESDGMFSWEEFNAENPIPNEVLDTATAFISIEFTLADEGITFPLKEGVNPRELVSKVPRNQFVNLEIEQMTIRKYGGRPHWGKNTVAIFEDAAQKYPRWDEFIQLKDKLDPGNVFTNDFFRRINGEILLEDLSGPGCNVTGECYCSIDEHCELESVCVEGSHFDREMAAGLSLKPAMVCRRWL